MLQDRQHNSDFKCYINSNTLEHILDIVFWLEIYRTQSSFNRNFLWGRHSLNKMGVYDHHGGRQTNGNVCFCILKCIWARLGTVLHVSNPAEEGLD